MKTPDWPTRSITRTFGSTKISLRLIQDFDAVLDYCAEHYPDNTDMIPYYAELWPSAEALANHLCRMPDIAGKSIVELGCGLGLPSILCARHGANVTATDFHPHNRQQLLDNAALNNVSIKYRQLDWANPDGRETFDLVIGSDLLYEKKQINTLAKCVTTLLKPGGRFILADPARDHIQDFVDAMHLAGFTHQLDIDGNILILTFQ